MEEDGCVAFCLQLTSLPLAHPLNWFASFVFFVRNAKVPDESKAKRLSINHLLWLSLFSSISPCLESRDVCCEALFAKRVTCRTKIQGRNLHLVPVSFCQFHFDSIQFLRYENVKLSSCLPQRTHQKSIKLDGSSRYFAFFSRSISHLFVGIFFLFCCCCGIQF